MTEFDIKENFEIHRNAGEGLARQLQIQFADFIRRNPSGTKFPPERKLAEQLNVSRVTVREALNYFSEQGLIVRNGSRGTFIAGAKEQVSDIHPMLREHVMYENAVTNLNLISFETHPQQRIFWNKIVDMFNAVNPSVSVTLKELPANISSSSYPKYILENGHDILMLQSGQNDLDELLAPLPVSIIKKLNSNDYFFKDFGVNLEKSIPIKSSANFICWNKTLAVELGIKDIPERLERGEMLELHREAAEKLPNGFCAGGHLWDYFSMKGTRSQMNKDFLEQRLEQFEKFSGISKMFICEQKYSLEVVDRFAKGELLFAPAISFFANNQNTPFDMGRMFFMPDENCEIICNTINLGIYRNSPNKKMAVDFIDFITSEVVQDLIVAEMYSPPCLKKSTKLFSKKLDNTNDQHIANYLKQSSFFAGKDDPPHCKQYNFMVFKIRDILYALMHGRLKSKQAAGIILKRWNQELKNG